MNIENIDNIDAVNALVDPLEVTGNVNIDGDVDLSNNK